MALDFPNTPTVGQVYENYTWDGEKWVNIESGGAGGGGTFIQAGAGAVERTMQDKARESVSVKDFGAVGDGGVDDYAAFFNAITYARTIGADVFVPSGRYRINMTGRTPLAIQEMAISGEHTGGLRGGAPPTRSGSMIEVVGTTASPFSLEYNSAIRRMTFIWPDQTNAAAPVAYPAGIRVSNGACVDISDIKMINAYVGIEHVTGGFITVDNCRISSFTTAVRFNTTFAENIVTRCDFSYSWGDDFYEALDPAGHTQRDAWRAYYRANSIGIEYTGTNADAQIIANNLFFSPSKGIYVWNSVADAYFWGTISGNIFDACFYGIHFGGRARPIQCTVFGGAFNFQSGTDNSNHIQIAMGGSVAEYDILFSGVHFALTSGSHVNVVAATTQPGRAVFSGCMFMGQGWNEAGGPYYSVYCESVLGSVVVSGCTFDGLGAALARGVMCAHVANVAVNGSIFRKMQVAVETLSIAKLTIVGNIAENVDVPVAGTAATIQKEANNSWN